MFWTWGKFHVTFWDEPISRKCCKKCIASIWSELNGARSASHRFEASFSLSLPLPHPLSDLRLQCREVKGEEGRREIFFPQASSPLGSVKTKKGFFLGKNYFPEQRLMHRCTMICLYKRWWNKFQCTRQIQGWACKVIFKARKISDNLLKNLFNIFFRHIIEVFL